MLADPSAFLEPGVTIILGEMSLGAHAYINRGTFIDCRGRVEIGARTLIGSNVTILTATHPVMESYPRAGPVDFEPVVIGANAWIGAASTILPGVIIEDGAVVAAGSLVRGHLEADTLYAGVPARPKKQLTSGQSARAGDQLN